MKAFNYFQPTELRFGSGRVGEAGEAVARYGKRCLLVTTPTDVVMEPLFTRISSASRPAAASSACILTG